MKKGFCLGTGEVQGGLHTLPRNWCYARGSMGIAHRTMIMDDFTVFWVFLFWLKQLEYLADFCNHYHVSGHHD